MFQDNGKAFINQWANSVKESGEKKANVKPTKPIKPKGDKIKKANAVIGAVSNEIEQDTQANGKMTTPFDDESYI